VGVFFVACLPSTEAIERVTIQDDGSLSIQIIGNAPPQGICGSGLVDLMSELLRTGRNERSRPLPGRK